jgi:hypothetical protein
MAENSNLPPEGVRVICLHTIAGRSQIRTGFYDHKVGRWFLDGFVSSYPANSVLEWWELPKPGSGQVV